MLRVETKARMSFENLLGFVSRYDKPFLFVPLLLLVLVEISRKLGPIDLKQVLDFMTFHK